MSDADQTPFVEAARRKKKVKHMKIQVANHATNVGPEEFVTAVAAIAAQAAGEFAAAYNMTPPIIEALIGGVAVDHEAMQHELRDKSDTPGALGYHDVDGRGRPVGYTFVETSKEDGVDWTTTFSHEILEQLADPYVSTWTMTPDNKMRAYEACDAVESDSYPKTVGDATVMVSNFLHPEYFAATPVEGMKTDHMNTLGGKVAPARSPGGYDIVVSTTGQVSQEFSDHMKAMAATRPARAAAKASGRSRTAIRLAQAARMGQGGQ